MSHSMSQSRTCGKCSNKVQNGAEFCPNCGNAFVDGLMCKNHKSQPATGVCIICCLAYCGHCATRVNKRFLCSDHESYEIYEGMARVYGVSDEAAAQYVRRCLEQDGLHPFLYSRKASPISGGGPDYTLFRASGEYDGHIINEVKVMVPCREVLQAERILKTLEKKR
jgi:hypothetical protein